MIDEERNVITVGKTDPIFCYFFSFSWCVLVRSVFRAKSSIDPDFKKAVETHPLIADGISLLAVKLYSGS